MSKSEPEDKYISGSYYARMKTAEVIAKKMTDKEWLAIQSGKSAFPINRKQALCLIQLVFIFLNEQAGNARNDERSIADYEEWCRHLSYWNENAKKYYCRKCGIRMISEEDPAFQAGQRVLEIIKRNL